MSNEVQKILDKIQAKKKLTLDEIADEIGYNRPYLNKAKLKNGASSNKLVSALQEAYPDIVQNSTPKDGRIDITTDLAKWMGEIQEEIIRLKARATVTQVTLEKLVSDSTGKAISTVTVELKQAIADLEKMLFAELREQNKKQ